MVSLAVQEMLQLRHSLQDTESGEPAPLELERRKQREKSSARVSAEPAIKGFSGY